MGKFAARTRTKSKNGFWLYPVIKFMQAINGKNRKISGRSVNNPAMGGAKHKISMGIITIKN